MQRITKLKHIVSPKLPEMMLDDYCMQVFEKEKLLLTVGPMIASVFLWLGIWVAWSKNIFTMQTAFSIGAGFQVFLILLICIPFFKGKARYITHYSSPLIYCFLSSLYMFLVMLQIEPEMLPGSHTIIIMMIICTYIFERISVRVASCSGILMSFLYVSFLHYYSISTVSDMQIWFHLVVANILGMIVSRYQITLSKRQFYLESNLSFEQKKSENLLLRILPVSIVERLKKSEFEIADHYTDVSLGFIDLVGFTKFASEHPAREVVGLLSHLFGQFDEAAERLGVEKIKTIGDAYMVACGCPEQKEDHAQRTARFALACVDIVREHSNTSKHKFDVRIGLATGSLIGGVLGSRRFGFDIWGDVVNVGSRMESAANTGEILATKEIYDLLTDSFDFKCPRSIEAKGKGEMQAYPLINEKKVEKKCA